MGPGRPCRHCTAQGCAIYENRPEDPCVRFRCGWLQNTDEFPEHMRPDRSGVIVLLDRKSHNWQIVLAVPAGRSVPAPALEWLQAYAQKTGTPLMFYERLVEEGSFTGVQVRAFGPRAFSEAVKYSVGEEDIVKM